MHIFFQTYALNVKWPLNAGSLITCLLPDSSVLDVMCACGTITFMLPSPRHRPAHWMIWLTSRATCALCWLQKNNNASEHTTPVLIVANILLPRTNRTLNERPGSAREAAEHEWDISMSPLHPPSPHPCTHTCMAFIDSRSRHNSSSRGTDFDNCLMIQT